MSKVIRVLGLVLVGAVSFSAAPSFAQQAQGSQQTQQTQQTSQQGNQQKKQQASSDSSFSVNVDRENGIITTTNCAGQTCKTDIESTNTSEELKYSKNKQVIKRVKPKVIGKPKSTLNGGNRELDDQRQCPEKLSRICQ